MSDLQPYYKNDYVTLYYGDCLDVIPILQCKFDCCVTDPPYEYLSIDWDKGFDHNKFVSSIYDVLSKDSMRVMFGRGSSFYRLNCMLEDAGMTFKEEIIWNKRYSTSPCLPLHRVHETISVFAKGKAKILKTRVPFMEKKQFDLYSLSNDIKRVASAVKNFDELQEIQKFIDSNKREDINKNHTAKHSITNGSIKDGFRSINTVNSIKNGLVESSIIRTDFCRSDTLTKHGITVHDTNTSNRAVSTTQAMVFGMNESSIIEMNREHYKEKHPTQKPVRLFERLLNISCPAGSLVIDPFAGSGTTGIACMNTNRKCVLIEKEKEYCDLIVDRLKEAEKQNEGTIPELCSFITDK